MTPQEITERLVAIRVEMMDAPAGAHVLGMERIFKARYPDALDEMSGHLVNDWLHRKCRDLIKPPKSDQTQLIGLGDVPDAVTTYDGEGGFRYKRLRFAAYEDLVNDEEIQRLNAIAASKAHDVAKDRNALLLPVMRAEGFATAGEAIRHLGNRP